jgi:hypothetical protein
MSTVNRYQEAYDAIKAVTAEHKAEVVKTAEMILTILARAEMPHTMVAMAALYSLAITGATRIIREEGDDGAEVFGGRDQVAGGDLGGADRA